VTGQVGTTALPKTSTWIWWSGIGLIILYWSSALWTPAFFGFLGFDPSRGIDEREWPTLVRALEVYHWPHRQMFRLFGPRLYNPETMAFPAPWTMYVAEGAGALITAVAWWFGLRLYLRRQPTLQS